MTTRFSLLTSTPMVLIHNEGEGRLGHLDGQPEKWFICPTASNDHVMLILKYGKDAYVDVTDDIAELNEVRLQWTEYPFPTKD